MISAFSEALTWYLPSVKPYHGYSPSSKPYHDTYVPSVKPKHDIYHQGIPNMISIFSEALTRYVPSRKPYHDNYLEGNTNMIYVPSRKPCVYPQAVACRLRVQRQLPGWEDMEWRRKTDALFRQNIIVDDVLDSNFCSRNLHFFLEGYLASRCCTM